jgi:hypothetical protein
LLIGMKKNFFSMDNIDGEDGKEVGILDGLERI